MLVWEDRILSNAVEGHCSKTLVDDLKFKLNIESRVRLVYFISNRIYRLLKYFEFDQSGRRINGYPLALLKRREVAVVETGRKGNDVIVRYSSSFWCGWREKARRERVLKKRSFWTHLIFLGPPFLIRAKLL